MEPCLAPLDKVMFYKYLDNVTNYFEFGSGGSTYQASLRQNIKSIYSIESDLVWHNKLKELIVDKEKITFKYCEMKTLSNTWGYPGADSTLKDWINYNDSIRDSDVSSDLDLVMIDGRFRVACCLKCFDVIDDECFIAFDDFLCRPYYYVVLDYFDIVEKTTNNRMVLLKKKSVVGPTRELVEKYEKVKE